MRVMVLVKATEDSEKGFVPTTEIKKSMEAMNKFRLRRAQAILTRQAYCV